MLPRWMVTLLFRYMFMFLLNGYKGESTTLLFNLEKNTMKEVSDNDQMDIRTVGYIDADKTHVTTNINGHSINKNNKYYHFRLNRKVTDINLFI